MNNQIEIKQLPQKVKATLLIENSFGLPVVRHVWLHKYGKSEKGYNEKVVAFYTIKGKKQLKGTKFDKVVIGQGWQEIEGAINTTKGSADFVSCDNVKFEALKAKVQGVIVEA